jgi:hypothetical protein
VFTTAIIEKKAKLMSDTAMVEWWRLLYGERMVDYSQQNHQL